MILTAHILTGSAIALKTQNPILGILFAFLSHFILDVIPHREYSIDTTDKITWQKSKKDFVKVLLDLIVGFSLVYFLTKGNIFILLGGFLGALPDALSFFYLIFKNNKLLDKISLFHQKVHYFSNNENLFGKNKKILFSTRILTQIIVIFISIYFFL